MMKIILCILSLVVGVLGFMRICYICKKDNIKKKEGKIVIGKKLGCEEMFGTPIRYIVEVEYEINNIANKRRIVTTDKNIKKCNSDESIALLYVQKNNKVYWAGEKSNESIVEIIIFLALSIFSFMLAFILALAF